ncbi:peptidylprolyl isomerase [Chromatium okenii]|uniref:peptidylprolyl isomerase n=1 Tax=Chromatium okenii TaxID=61644 RepID=UPI001908720C|nr:peptidyl-prolyl cis-trans isomerase [Chromatium okenii]MBK1640301.1 peptidylprolyl isomerase [Chromatium okenii]
MKLSRLPLVLCIALAVGNAWAEEKKESDSPDTLIATVNGTPYQLDVFRVFYLSRVQQNQGENTPAMQQQAFDEFMGLIVASQEGERRKLEADRNVIAALKLERMKVLSNAALGAMAQEMKVTDDELKAAYDKIKAQGGRTEFKARHILVKDEDEAKKLIKQLDKGADFAELAKKHSTGPTGKDGGDLGWFDPKQMVPAFATAIADMKPGSYSKTPVQTQFGWHVINLQETRKAEPPPFDDAKPQLTALVQRQKLSEKIVEMRNNAKIDLNEAIVKITPNKDAPAVKKD